MRRRGAGVAILAGLLLMSTDLPAAAIPPTSGDPRAAISDTQALADPDDPTVLAVAPRTDDAPEPDRVAGPDRSATAITAARRGWSGGADTVVLAGAGASADALAAGPLAIHHDAPLLLTPADGTTPELREAVTDLAPDRVIIVGGPSAVSQAVTAELVADGRVVDRLDGVDRFATAAAVARAVGGDGGHVLIAAGDATADALAAGALAAVADPPPPLLLVTAAAVPDATAEALTALAPDRVTVLGGTGVVSDQVIAAVEAETGALTTRVAGADRWGTAVAALDAALDERRRQAVRDDEPVEGDLDVVVASGLDWPDALAAGPLAARLGATTLLVPPWRLTDDGDAALRALGPSFGDVLGIGGGAALEDSVLVEVAAALDGTARPIPPYAVSIDVPTATEREAMTGPAWQPGCPVELDDLRVLRVRHRTFDGGVATGRMVVAASVADDVAVALGELYDRRFPIARMAPIEDYDGSDDASMAANNAVALHCRPVTGGGAWSQHSYGHALDLNPHQNPYRRNGTVLPAEGADFLDRDDLRLGMLTRPGAIEVFDAIGWGWGGDWTSLDDWMHVSATGR